MIWIEAVVNFVFALLTFLYLNEIIPGDLGFLLATVILWSIQTQLLPQIIANRVALIMTNRRRARHLKWGLFISIICVNIAVCYIFTVAHLETATFKQKYVNIVFEKAEKSFFLIIDLTLNLYFLYLVRYRLIADGLNKYVQFAPLAYIVKLYIELLMANLISKVVRGQSHSRGGEGWYSGSRDKSNPTNYGITSRVVVHLATYPEPHGITKTIETTIVVRDRDSDRTSKDSI
ncbi:hypothetical protein FPSE_12207 [Fusarium pseudograminearum CS3096]|uniref:Uncharacterized protein n=1 Tax=Fusarium pseudograminearum (strain CS3096) TaxID=1028729 RepID=K3U8P4_FUSPC|nr:hypothetical protein FPSE_12207 [Fusarium pseudograminearum CS3096]EKJ67626.1 hypothetical protein FPSE_12207 [Fusarium pseudograminearum CS3096]